MPVAGLCGGRPAPDSCRADKRLPTGRAESLRAQPDKPVTRTLHSSVPGRLELLTIPALPDLWWANQSKEKAIAPAPEYRGRTRCKRYTTFAASADLSTGRSPAASPKLVR